MSPALVGRDDPPNNPSRWVAPRKGERGGQPKSRSIPLSSRMATIITETLLIWNDSSMEWMVSDPCGEDLYYTLAQAGSVIGPSHMSVLNLMLARQFYRPFWLQASVVPTFTSYIINQCYLNREIQHSLLLLTSGMQSILKAGLARLHYSIT